MENNKKYDILRSEYVKDILSKTPSNIIIFGNTAIFFICLFLTAIFYNIPIEKKIDGQILITKKNEKTIAILYTSANESTNLLYINKEVRIFLTNKDYLNNSYYLATIDSINFKISNGNNISYLSFSKNDNVNKNIENIKYETFAKGEIYINKDFFIKRIINDL